ncbi:GlcG/HbpS family heme-binding protein [Massilia sp. DD77]|uniref:GlcG/HbpS family heme-binding protein n=1 Tax=Massilia sp. DD77 TaxID=3109349 RepID=UPI002FFD9C71
MRRLLFALLLSAVLPHAGAEPLLKSQLSTRIALNLAAAKQISNAAEAEARRNGWNVSIVVVDDAGALMHALRMDDTPNNSLPIALAKATHAANFRRDTKFHEDILTKGNQLVLALPDAMPLEGGVRLLVDGKLIGAIGVSGVQAPQDGQIARAGAALLAP